MKAKHLLEHIMFLVMGALATVGALHMTHKDKCNDSSVKPSVTFPAAKRS